MPNRRVRPKTSAGGGFNMKSKKRNQRQATQTSQGESGYNSKPSFSKKSTRAVEHTRPQSYTRPQSASSNVV